MCFDRAVPILLWSTRPISWFWAAYPRAHGLGKSKIQKNTWLETCLDLQCSFAPGTVALFSCLSMSNEANSKSKDMTGSKICDRVLPSGPGNYRLRSIKRDHYYRFLNFASHFIWFQIFSINWALHVISVQIFQVHMHSFQSDLGYERGWVELLWEFQISNLGIIAEIFEKNYLFILTNASFFTEGRILTFELFCWQ